MKRLRFTEEQIIGILKEQEAGAKTADICRKHGISDATFYKYKAKYGGMDVSDARKLKALEDENAKLKKLLTESMLDNAILKDVASKNVWSPPCKVRDIADDDSSCISVSGLSQVGCGCSQAMMRSAHAVPNKWFGHEARFFAQGLRHVDPLFRHHSSRALQSSRERQANAGSLRSYSAPGLVRTTQTILAILAARATTALFGCIRL